MNLKNNKVLLLGCVVTVVAFVPVWMRVADDDARSGIMSVDRTESSHSSERESAATADTSERKRSTIDECIDEALALMAATNAAGGLEMSSAAFHQFPGDGMSSIVCHAVYYNAPDMNGVPTGVLGLIKVDMRRDEVLTRGIEATNIVGNGAMHDLRVRFNPSIPPYAQERQKAREWAIANTRWPDDEGVALVHNNFIYGEFTYGAIAQAAANGGWVTVVIGTSLLEATAIAQALHP